MPRETALIHASELGRMPRERKRMDEAVDAALHQIDEQLRIQQNSQIGSQTLVFTLPGHVYVLGLAQKDVLLYVHAKIIAALEASGYVVYLVQDKGAAVLYINWSSEIEPMERQAMAALIKRCTRTMAPTGQLTRQPTRQVYRRGQ